MSTPVRSVWWWSLLIASLVLLPPAAHAAHRSADAADDDVPVQADPRRSEPAANTDGQQEQPQDDEALAKVTETLLKVYQASTSATCLGTGTHLKTCKWGLFAWALGPQCTITECAAGEYCFTPCLGQSVCIEGKPQGEPLIETAQCLKPDLVVATSCADAGATKTTVVVKGVKAAVMQPCPATNPYCQNGACVPANQVTCIDSDASPVTLQQLATGQQYDLLALDPSLTTPGTVEGAGGKTYSDICKGSAFLLEQACDAQNLPVQVAIPCKQFPGGSCTDVEGSRCVIDTDGDSVPDAQDNCETVANVDQADSNGNNVGDACDLAPATTQCPVDFLMAHEIVPGDANANGLYDSCEFPQLVSVGSQGVSGNDTAFLGAGDAGFATMTFVSQATNLTTPPLPQPALAVYLRRRLQGTTTMLAKAQSMQVSGTGRFVVMTQQGKVQDFSLELLTQLWVYDTALATFHAVEIPTPTFTPGEVTPLAYLHLAVSADGRWLAAVAHHTWFEAPGNGVVEVLHGYAPLLYDRLTGQTTYLTQQGDHVNGGLGVSMSDDGSVLAFLETCSPETVVACPAVGQNITNLFWYHRESGVKTIVPLPSTWQVRANIAPVVSGNGQYIFFAADPKLVSLPGNKDPSRIFRYDLVANTLTDTSFNVLLPFSGASIPFLSVDAEGRYLVVNAWDGTYLYNATSGAKALLTTWYGTQGLPTPSTGVALSRDGRFLVTTFFNDVVWNDTNKLPDVYMVPNPWWEP